jgi:hypothetical protein
MFKKYLLSLVAATFLVTGANAGSTSSTDVSAVVGNSIDVSTALGATMTISSDLDVINGSFSSNTNTFTIKANGDATTYNVWLTVPAGNWDLTNTQVYAANTTYKLPIIATLTGTTNNASGDGTGLAGTGVSVSRTIEANTNAAPTATQTTGFGVDGTDLDGDLYTITLTLDSAQTADGYKNIPDGTYTVTITANTLVTN